MDSYLAGSKLRKSGSGNIVSHLATYQGEPIRNSGPHTIKKQKSNRRVITQYSQKGLCITSQIKKATKQFKLPFKSVSPKMKKNILDSHTTSNKKLVLANAKKKSVPMSSNKPLLYKVHTETGGLIKKKKINTQQKKHVFNKQQKHVARKQFFEFKEQRKTQQHDQKRPKQLQLKPTLQKKYAVKEHGAPKSQKVMTEYHKMRLKTEGTFDSTPYVLGNNDVQILSLIGQGTFGKVYKGRIVKTGQLVAIKKVYQDPKYKNREIEIVEMLNGEFVMKVLGTYTTIEGGSQYLSIIMHYYDSDLFNYIKGNGKKGLGIFDIKLITYQMFRGLAYIHSLGICHRDIKPHNILVKNKKTVICDFGSAKILTSQPNLPYICSRCYRAPELIFGATHYSTMIDVWSAGCVILEMIQGNPLFIGESSIDHLIEIIKVMGTPTKTQVIDMNPEYDLNDYKFPKIKKKDWAKLFPKTDPLLLDFLSQIMIYSPNQRLTAVEALCHEFFDELKEEKNGKIIEKNYNIDLFTFNQSQLQGNEHLLPQLVPGWVKH